MPDGCKERFGWNRDCSGGILKTKYPYGETSLVIAFVSFTDLHAVLHGVQAAIIDALKQHADLEGATL